MSQKFIILYDGILQNHNLQGFFVLNDNNMTDWIMRSIHTVIYNTSH